VNEILNSIIGQFRTHYGSGFPRCSAYHNITRRKKRRARPNARYYIDTRTQLTNKIRAHFPLGEWDNRMGKFDQDAPLLETSCQQSRWIHFTSGTIGQLAISRSTVILTPCRPGAFAYPASYSEPFIGEPKALWSCSGTARMSFFPSMPSQPCSVF